MSLDDELAEWAEQTRQPAPNRSEISALVARAEHRGSGRWALPIALGATGLAALAALVALAVMPAQPPKDAPAVAIEDDRPEPSLVIEAPDRRSLSAGQHALGGDQIEVAQDGFVEVIDGGLATELALRTGQVTVHAAPRSAGESLSVTHDDWTVRVVGTRFMVVDDPFTVRVTEGVVRVTGPDTDTTLRAGDVLVEGQIQRAKPTRIAPSLPPLSELKQLLLDGRSDAARQGLSRRLAASPNDVPAWTLLAQLEGRAGAPDAAVTAWREVISRGNKAEAQRARYEAAVILDGRPAEVVPLLTAFLADPGPLAPEAGVRLGRALLVLGRDAEAKARLQAVIDASPGTSSAREARALLRAD
ncbi:MAG: hypothetical protein AB8H79_00840 [Myxococcota bacterium]